VNPSREPLGVLDAESAAALLAVAADIVLVIDQAGVVRDLTVSGEQIAADFHRKWIGRRWIDTVTVESRPKIEALLKEAGVRKASRWRQVNHPRPRGPDLPVLYATMRVGRDGRMVAVGRDLQATAQLQQRLVDVQQAMERDYARLRQMEMRYRLLFQMTSEAVLIVDAASRKVVEANPAAAQLLGAAATGETFPEGFEAQSAQGLLTALARVRVTGRPETVRGHLAEGDRECTVAISLFRQESAPLFLIRVAPAEADAPATALTPIHARLLQIVESGPDAVVVTGLDGRILAANGAFLDLAQLATEEQARGETLDRWLGRPGVDLNVLIANLRQHGMVRLFATTLRGEYGVAAEIEVSGVAVTQGDQPCLGFTIRAVGRRLPAETRAARELPRSVEQLTELVGRVPLKDLVRETTDVIERLCIEAALEITGDNRASAAEILGLSRQSLYVKLRRYGLGDLGSEGEE
jgi:transcriptional regulator PpsR